MNLCANKKFNKRKFASCSGYVAVSNALENIENFSLENRKCSLLLRFMLLYSSRICIIYVYVLL